LKKVNVIVCSVFCFQLFVATNSSAALSPEEIFEKCQPLRDAVKAALDNRKKKVLIEADGISGGGSLSEASCVDQLLDFEFDAFALSGLGGVLSGVFDKIKQQALEQLSQLVCDFADDLKHEADEFLSCTATFSVNLEAMGDLPSPDLQSCLGSGFSGSDYGYTYSSGEGDSSIGINEGGTIGAGVNDPNPKQVELFESINSKIGELNGMGDN
jgi:hypothetical protein